MNQMFCFLMSGLLAAFFFSCSNSRTTGPNVAGGGTDTEWSLTGTVYTDQGTPAPSVTISLYNNYEPLSQRNTALATAITDNKGQYAFDNIVKGVNIIIIGKSASNGQVFFAEQMIGDSVDRKDTLALPERIFISIDTSSSLRRDSCYILMLAANKRFALDSTALNALSALPQKPVQAAVRIVLGDTTINDTGMASVKFIRWALVGMVYEYLGYIMGTATLKETVHDPFFGPINPDTVPFGAVMFQNRDSIFFLGGYNEDDAPISRALLYTMTNSKWENIGPFGLSQAEVGATVLSGRLLIYGGISFPGLPLNVESFDPGMGVFRSFGILPDTMAGLDGRSPSLFTTCMGKIYSVSTQDRDFGLSVFESSDGLRWKRYDKMNAKKPFGTVRTASPGIRNQTVVTRERDVIFLGGDSLGDAVNRASAFSLDSMCSKRMRYMSVAKALPVCGHT